MKGFNSCIEVIKNDIKSNKQLAKECIDDITEVIFNNTKVLEILHEYKHGNLSYKIEEWSDTYYIYLKNHEESINSSKITKGNLIKYKKFKDNFENSFGYIIIKEYKNPIIKLKGLLKLIKNTKISNLYTNFNDLKFTDENIKKIDNLYTRLNKYLSDNIFNQIYILKINNFKNGQIKEIQDIYQYIEKLNDQIKYDEEK